MGEDGSHLPTGSFWSPGAVWRLGETVKIHMHTHTQTNLAACVVLCWLDSPHCDLNLFCLEYKCPVGS